jgi:hypothetical protein
MKKVEEYRAHVAECRAMARRSRCPDERQMLLKMADTWDSLALNRQGQIARQECLVAIESGPGGTGKNWSRLSEQFLRIDKWSVCRG